MNAIQTLDQADALRRARALLGEAQDKISEAMDALEGVGVDELVETLAHDFGGVAATRTILRLRANELESPGPYHLPRPGYRPLSCHACQSYGRACGQHGVTA